MESISDLLLLPNDARVATKFVLGCILDKIQPTILRIRNKLQSYGDDEGSIARVRDVYTLCTSQISKCLVNLFEIFKLELHHQTILQETRQYSLERLSWCLNRLITIDNHLEKRSSLDQDENGDDSLNITTMYFVNWIDHTFEVLSKLADLIYKTDYKEPEALYEEWKNDMVECVSELHLSIDELLLSAMTLCRYCLPGDQPIVKARCQVVLRETKALLSEVIEGDLSTAIKAAPEALKLPIMPSNINVLIDVLKDVLYALETNTNTALLSLLVHCFSYGKPPVAVLKDHFNNDTKDTCACLVKSADEVTEDCSFVKEFDLYNERLIQIGNFAVSCSSDQNRILKLRSGLASLEALDPHLVPALMMSPDSYHTELLVNSWLHEVLDIRDSVFLIVDPAAFAEKSKQMMHQLLLSIMKGDGYSNADVCVLINIGCVLHELFTVYERSEPEALAHHDKLIPLLADLDKVQTECKIVSNLLTSNDDFVYNVKMPKNNKEASMDQLLKRLKLLYTLVTRINSLLHPKENDDQLFDEEDEPQMSYKNTTHTVCRNSDTYVHSPRKPSNVSRSIFARNTVRSSTRNIPLAVLTKHIKAKMCTELSFSTQLDQLFSGDSNSKDKVFAKHLDSVKECSVLYNFSPIKNRSLLRKAVLNRLITPSKDRVKMNLTYDKEESLMDETTSLEITDILKQMNDMTSILSVTKSQPKLAKSQGNNNKGNKKPSTNVLTLNINNPNATISKHIWNIPVNTRSVGMALDESAVTSNMSQSSNVTTLERINDLDFVESKLNSLKSQLETSL